MVDKLVVEMIVAIAHETGKWADDDPVIAAAQACAAIAQKRVNELEAVATDGRNALQAMMDAWLDYHDTHSLTQPVTGAAENAFEKALAARDNIDAALPTMLKGNGDG